MSTQLVESPRLDDSLKESMVHIACLCFPKEALCGTPLTNIGVGDQNDCLVCEDLAPLPCPRCGQ